MSRYEVGGGTLHEIALMHYEYWQKHRDDPEAPPFTEKYCLSPIGKQPEGYDGPQRYCKLCQYMGRVGSVTRCKFHGGYGKAIDDDTRKEPHLAPMKHGMKALRENLIDDFDEKDQALYDWIMDSYPEAYDLEPESDPQVALDLHRYAAEIVRAERGRGYLLREGEVTEKKRFTDDGVLIVNEDGEVETEKSEHYLAGMLHRQDKKLTDLARELGVTRRERLKQESTDSAVEAIKDFAQIGDSFIDRDSKDFDPNEEEWTTDDGPNTD